MSKTVYLVVSNRETEAAFQTEDIEVARSWSEAGHQVYGISVSRRDTDG
jgi:hypothetical protein